ncbi:MAG: hypothetical protein ACI959_000728 [Limisphaerales bacterium]|jgi:hypothetical protein
MFLVIQLIYWFYEYFNVSKTRGAKSPHQKDTEIYAHKHVAKICAH